MSDPVLFFAGAFLVALALVDFLATTVGNNGVGPITRLLSFCLWRLWRPLASGWERLTGGSIRNLVGPSILVTLGLTWIALHLTGYALMYAADASLADPETGAPATRTGTFAYAGSILSTLGASRVQATGPWWDFLSMVAATNGMIVLTLSVSYVLGVIHTTSAMRSFALRLNALTEGARAMSREEMLARVAPLGPTLCTVAVRLSASPLPGLFVPGDRTLAFPEAVVALCRMLPDETDVRHADPRTAELRAGLRLLGRSVRRSGDRSDFEAVELWAERHSIPDMRACGPPAPSRAAPERKRAT